MGKNITPDSGIEAGRLPEFDKHIPGDVMPRDMRPSVGGKVKYKRVPIRRRRLKHELVNFLRWISHLLELDQKMLEKDGDQVTFFAGKTAMLIMALDGEEMIRLELGTEEQLKMLQDAIKGFQKQEGESSNENT